QHLARMLAHVDGSREDRRRVAVEMKIRRYAVSHVEHVHGMAARTQRRGDALGDAPCLALARGVENRELGHTLCMLAHPHAQTVDGDQALAKIASSVGALRTVDTCKPFSRAARCSAMRRVARLPSRRAIASRSAR